jgi:hypothetical protein
MSRQMLSIGAAVAVKIEHAAEDLVIVIIILAARRRIAIAFA